MRSARPRTRCATSWTARSASLLFALVLLLPLAARGGAAEAPVIDLFTMGPGDDIFSRFGHAAICVTDEESPGGRCYNYGTTDFSTPLPLTWDFVRGRALFWVSVIDLPRMLRFYEARDRTIYRQRLPLPGERARELRAALMRSTEQHLKYYRYHHFHDNCTTRIRDLIDRATGGRLRQGAERHDGPTFREFARRGFAGDVPLLLAAELLLGRSADERTSAFQAMFLPEVLRDEVARRLSARVEVLHERRARAGPGSVLLGRLAEVALGGGLALLIVLLGASRAPLALSGVLFGLVGLCLHSLALLSTFPELRYNEAMLVFLPSDLVLGALPRPFCRRYLAGRLAGLLALLPLLAVGLLVQPLLPSLLGVGLPLATTYAILRRT